MNPAHAWDLGMANFFAELKRRNIYRVGAAYAVVAWVLVQLVANVTPIMDLPPWFARAILLLLVIGFPITLVFAWVHEIAPGSVRRGSGWGDATTPSQNKVDWILTSALVVVIALMSYQQLAPTRTVPQASIAPVTSPGTASIAVLPFVNLSSDAEQEFFSDGMTEEITTALAKVQGLIVIGRTSAFEFKGQNRDLRMIGQALGTTHLIEGSVRKAGNRVRITAQLIRADSGAHLWTQNYDRELTDIFAIQEEIAEAIAGALRVPLGLARGERLVSNRVDDVDTYQQFLRAKALVRGRGLARLTSAVTLLEQVVADDRGFTPAWALLGQTHALIPSFSPERNSSSGDEFRRIAEASFQNAEAAARRSIELDPNNADGYLALGLAQDNRGKFLPAEELYAKALELDPNNPDALFRQGLLLAETGRVKEALAVLERLRVLEPFVPIYNANTARVMSLNGRDAEAIELLKDLPTDYGLGQSVLAYVYAAAGRYSEAADLLTQIPTTDVATARTIQDAARLLRTAPAMAASPEALPHLGHLDFAYLHVGAPSRVLDIYELNVEAGYLNAVDNLVLWRAPYSPVRKTERFKTFVRKAGFVDYWRAKGWPEFCRPTGADDFVCD